MVNFKSNHRSISVVHGLHVSFAQTMRLWNLLSFSQPHAFGKGAEEYMKKKKTCQIYAPDALYLTRLISSHAQASFWVKGVICGPSCIGSRDET